MDWPLYLPKPSQTYSTSLDPNLAQTDFEIGFRQRRKYSVDEERISVRWTLTQFQFDIFRTFLELDLEHGALPFFVDIIGLDGLENRQVRIEGGKFQSQYKPHQTYIISANLVCVAAPVFPVGLYEFLISLETSDPSEFILTSDVLNLYIESVFGESFLDERTADFLTRYS